MIYLDNAATSFPKPESVYKDMDSFNRYMGGNPGRGSNEMALRSGAVLLETREALARLFNISDCFNIAFTYNVTDSINMALKGMLKPGDHVITTSMEHNAVARPLHVLSEQGVEWTKVLCDHQGRLDPIQVKLAIKSNTKMICMLHASNLIGTIMPIHEIGRIAAANNVLFMVDSAQTAGVLDIDTEKMKIDILAFTGHKGLLGPQGTGGIYLRPGLAIEPLRYGGTGSLSENLEQPLLMPDRLESGTLNSPGIAGLLSGVNFLATVGVGEIRRHEQYLTDLLLTGLKSIPKVKIYGPNDSSLQTAVVAFNIEGMDCGDLSYQLDYRYKIISRSGLHCAPLAHQTIGTFETGLCRLSPGYFNTESDIKQAVQAVATIAEHNCIT